LPVARGEISLALRLAAAQRVERRAGRPAPTEPVAYRPDEETQIMTMSENARAFFEACETGKGWSVCKAWCQPDATFSCQADALGEVTSLSGYAEWMKGLLGAIPDGRYELEAFATDTDRGTVVAAAVFHGSHTGTGGPVPATGKRVAADYVYVMHFDGAKIRHMTKIWNDGHSLRALGWA
jgi:predicted ester cyclase